MFQVAKERKGRPGCGIYEEGRTDKAPSEVMEWKKLQRGDS
jgi:hypothetical protein